MTSSMNILLAEVRCISATKQDDVMLAHNCFLDLGELEMALKSKQKRMASSLPPPLFLRAF